MANPFAGMNPYLEAHWGDVHTSLVTYARNQLRPQLPGDLRARVEEHVSLHLGETPQPGGFYSDVRVVDSGAAGNSEEEKSRARVAEPLVVTFDAEAETQRSVQIIDTISGGRVVTAIEFLSPSNKIGVAGVEAYRHKQRSLLEGGVNLVEIDLLRAGQFVIVAPVHRVPASHRSPYRICVVRANRPGRAELYRTSLRQPLPKIRVPLRETDEDVLLDLQALVEQAYEDGGYADLDYRVDALPALEERDAAWADGLLREKRLR